jgi:CRISPR system Cascade subunit CasA
VKEGQALRLVSLEQGLLEASRFERIEDLSPLVTAALHRLLLAVLHRALEGPEDAYQAAGWFKNGFDAEKVRVYLAHHKGCFDVFHPDTPFYQVPDFTLEHSSRSWTVLAPELNSDNNKVLFDHTVTTQPRSLQPSEAARLLVANQTFALSAGKSVLCHTATAPVATAALAVMLGDNLHQTLCLNLVSYPQSQRERDFATWERPPLKLAHMENCEAAKDHPKGIVHRYTWLSRSIRLEPEEENGQTVVRWIAYASGIRYEETQIRPDPMVAFRPDSKDPTKLYQLGFREGKALWRDFSSLLPKPGSAQSLGVAEHARNVFRALGRHLAKQGIPVLVSGQANDQAKVELWRGEIYRLPEAILSEADLHIFVKQCLDEADKMGSALNSAARALAAQLLTLGDRQPHKDDVSKLVKSFPHQTAYWSALEAHFGAWVQRLGLDFEEQQTQLEKDWLEVLKAEALKAWSLTTRAAGDDARALRAVQKSEGILLAQIYPSKEAVGANRKAKGD